MPGKKEIAEYIKKVKPRHSFRGINEDDMWMIILNIQKYYEERAKRTEASYKAVLDELRGNNGHSE